MIAAATVAQNAGIHIDAVGVGTADGTTVELDGYQIHTALDAEQLTAIAQTTGGSYHPASDAAQLDGVASDIDLRLTVADQDVPAGGRVHRGRPGPADHRRPADRRPHRKVRVMTFVWPWALLSLLIIPIVVLTTWLLRRRRRRAAVRVTSIALVRAALPTRSRWIRLIPGVLLMLGFATLGVGAARPQASVPVASDSTTIMLAMDVSGSMCSTDVEPNRLTVAQQAAIAFIEAQDGGPKIGLVAFSGFAAVQVPPTTDTDQLIEAINNFSTSRGTAIGSAILTSIDGIADDRSDGGAQRRRCGVGPALGVRLRRHRGAHRRREHPGRRTGGGRRSGGRPRRTRVHHRLRHHQPHPDGLHRPAGRRLGRRRSGWLDGVGRLGVGRDGRNPLVIDEDALQDVAETTGGQYYRAESADQLQEALGDLPSHVTVVTQHVDIASWFAAVGGLLVAAALALSLWWNRVRTPGRVGRAG